MTNCADDNYSFTMKLLRLQVLDTEVLQLDIQLGMLTTDKNPCLHVAEIIVIAEWALARIIKGLNRLTAERS